MKYSRINRFNRRVYRAIHPEFKIKTAFYSGSIGTYNASALIKCLNETSQGDGADTRTGNRILVKMIKIRFQIYLSGASTSDFNAFRIMIVKYKPANEYGSPLINDVLDMGNSGGNHLGAFRRLDTSNQYKIIKDTGLKKIGGVGGLKPQMYFEWYLKMNTVTVYSQNGGTDADISQNLLAFYCWTDQGANYPEYYMDYNIRFIDC